MRCPLWLGHIWTFRKLRSTQKEGENIEKANKKEKRGERRMNDRMGSRKGTAWMDFIMGPNYKGDLFELQTFHLYLIHQLSQIVKRRRGDLMVP